MEIKRILTPVDFSELSTAAWSAACVLARAVGAEVDSVHVVAAPVPTMVAYPGMSAETIRRESERCEQRMAAICAGLEACRHVTVRHRARAGHVVDELNAAIAQLQPDLIALGTHGRSPLEKLLLGSVAAHILRASTVPVLSITSREPWSSWPIQRVLLAADTPELATVLADPAVTIARAAGAEIVPVLVESDGERLEGTARRIDDALRQAAERLSPTQVRTGRPGPAIIGAATDIGADLIVLGLPRKRVVDRLVIGSTVDRVVRGATCPVLSVPLLTTSV